MNHLNIDDEKLHGLLGEFKQLIKEKGLADRIAIDEVHFRSALSENCRQVPVCRQVTDPLTNRTHPICNMETVCD